MTTRETGGSQSTPKVAVLDEAFASTSGLGSGGPNPGTPHGDTLPHGTAVAGVLSEAVAHAGNAHPETITIDFGRDTLVPSFQDAMAAAQNADVVNASWGVGKAFMDNFQDPGFQEAGAAIDRAVTEGRDGKGAVLVFAAGNARADGDNVNHHNFQNAPETIAVGAVDATGAPAAFSTPGASVLLSARGVDVQARGQADGLDGTSFAAPKVAAAVTDMLAVNNDLGYRDVQAILAATAAPANLDPDRDGTVTNGADTWNGGGMTFNPRVGFGVLDHEAAVRLAGAWQDTASTQDARTANAASDTARSIAAADAGGLSVDLEITDNLRVEHATLDVEIDHPWIGNLSVELISPDGTTSRLLDRPGVGPDSTSGFGDSSSGLDFELTSAAFRGEDAQGTWTVRVQDHQGVFDGELESVALDLIGEAATHDDTQILTDSFAQLADQAQRTSIVDTDGGDDTLQAAALSDNARIDLRDGVPSTIAGRDVDIDGFEKAFAGAGDDTLRGNARDNDLHGGAGDDTLIAGLGDDTLTGGAGADVFDFRNAGGDNVITDFDPNEGDRIAAEAVETVSQRAQDTGPSTTIELSDGSSITLEGVSDMDADWLLA